MKKLNWKIFFIIALIVFISPLHWYSKWHLKNFEYGFLKVVSALFYAPYDYRDIVWSGVLYPNELYDLSISHNYLGAHEIRVGLELEQHEISFELFLNCESGFTQHFSSRKMGAYPPSEYRKDPIVFGRYQVSQFADFGSCQIRLETDETEKPFFVYFRSSNLL